MSTTRKVMSKLGISAAAGVGLGIFMIGGLAIINDLVEIFSKEEFDQDRVSKNRLTLGLVSAIVGTLFTLLSLCSKRSSDTSEIDNNPQYQDVDTHIVNDDSFDNEEAQLVPTQSFRPQ